MTAIIKSNANLSPIATLGNINAVTMTPADAYTAYAARVAADGGTIEDATATLAAITAALNGGYLYGAAMSYSPRWGVKLSGSNYVKFYSLNGADAVVSSGVVTRITTARPYPTAQIVNSGTSPAITAAGVPITLNNKSGWVSSDDTDSSLVSPTLTFTVGGHLYMMSDGYGRFYVSTDTTLGNVVLILDESTNVLPTAGSKHFYFDVQSQFVTVGFAGVDRKSGASFTPWPVNTVADLVMNLNGAATRNIVEEWWFNNCSVSQIKACAFDASLRY